MINTKAVPDRRTLHFDSLDALFADVDQLAVAEREGRLVQLGNWPLGKAINHLATWAEFAFNGSPTRPPWPIRLAARLFKGRVLTKGFSPGTKIPGVEGGTYGLEIAPTDGAIARLRRVLERFRNETPEQPNGLLGRLTRQEWIELHLRHAELHLSFFKAKSPGS